MGRNSIFIEKPLCVSVFCVSYHTVSIFQLLAVVDKKQKIPPSKISTQLSESLSVCHSVSHLLFSRNTRKFEVAYLLVEFANENRKPYHRTTNKG